MIQMIAPLVKSSPVWLNGPRVLRAFAYEMPLQFKRTFQLCRIEEAMPLEGNASRFVAQVCF